MSASTTSKASQGMMDRQSIGNNNIPTGYLDRMMPGMGMSKPSQGPQQKIASIAQPHLIANIPPGFASNFNGNPRKIDKNEEEKSNTARLTT